MKLLPYFYVFCLVFLSACNQAPPENNLNEGQLFPALHLSGLDRADIRIDDFRGRIIILNVWATWCGPCRDELPGLQQLQKKFSENELLVIGLNVDDDIHIAREFLLDQKINFANYTDTDMFIAQQILGIRLYPDTFIIAANGTLLRSIAGARDWAGVDIYEAIRMAIIGQTDLLAKI